MNVNVVLLCIGLTVGSRCLGHLALSQEVRWRTKRRNFELDVARGKWTTSIQIISGSLHISDYFDQQNNGPSTETLQRASKNSKTKQTSFVNNNNKRKQTGKKAFIYQIHPYYQDYRGQRQQ